MARSTIATLKGKSEGFDKVRKDLDRTSNSTQQLDRRTTRLGQSSASSARSFSSQASGLGGLVGVYAAAAANVFAITAAFEALGRAAQAEQIVRGTKTLALEIGQNGAQILKSVQEITQSQLTLAEASQNINIALAAGFNTKQIEDLSEVSIKASRALGRNLTDAFQRVVRGAAKLEPELLDELGIFTRIDPAVRQYAKSLNVAESSLTNYEKRQAFVNAVITEGQRKFSSISVVTDSAQKSLEQLQVALTELAIEFGQLLANGLLPLINFIKNNAGVTLLAFLGILNLVFGKLGSSITAFTVGGLNNLANFTDGLATKAQQSSAAIGDLTNKVEDFNAAVKTRGGLVGKTGSLAGTGAFAGGLDRDTAQQASAARRRFAQGGATVKQQERDIKVLTRAQEQLEKAGRKNSLAYRDSAKIIETYTNAAKGATARTRAFAAVSEIASTALRGLTTVARYAGIAFNGLFGIIAIAQLAGTLFDRDFLGEIKEFFFGIRQEAENLKAGLTGAVTATAGGAKQLEEQLRRLGATDTQLKELPETFREIETDVGKTINSINNKIKGGLIGEAGGRLQDAGIQMTPRQFAELSSQQQQLAGLQGELLKAQQDDTQQGRIRVKIIESLIKVYEDLYGATELIGAVSRELNLSNEKTAKIFKDISESSDEGVVTFKALGFSVDSTKQSFADLSAEQQKLIIANTLVVNTSNDAFEAFNAGTATAETLSKKLGGITQELNKLKKNAEGLDGDALAGAMSEIEDLEARRQELNGLVRSLKNLEVIGKNLTDVYGKYGKALDEAFSKGNISFRGIAKNAEAAAENQAQFLIDATEFGRKAQEVNDALAKRARIERQILIGAQTIERLNSIEVKTLENRDRAVKSIAGTVFSLALAIEKQALAQDKTVQSLKDQKDLLILQLGLVREQNKLRLTQAQQQNANEQSAKNNDIAAARLELVKQSAEATENEARHVKELNSLTQERLSILRDIEDIQKTGADRAARSVREAGIAQQESRISDMQAFPGLSSTAQLQAEQRELIRLQYENEIEIIAAKERQSERDRNRALAEINFRKININNEIAAAKEQRESAVNRQKDEMALLEATQALELKKLEDQKSNLEIQQRIAQAEATIAERRVKVTEAQFAFENKAREIQVKAVEFQALVVDKLSEVLNDDSSAFVSAIRTYVEAIGGDASAIQPSEVISNLAADAAALRDEFGEIQKLQEKVLKRQRDLNKEQFDSATKFNDEQKSRLSEVIRLTKTQFQLQKDLANAKSFEEVAEIDRAIILNNNKLNNLKLESDRAEKLFNDKKTQFDEERALAKRNANEQLRNLERIKKTLGDLANAISEDLQKGFENVVTTVFDNIASGQDVGKGLREALFSTFEDIRKSILQETLIEPGKEFIKEQIGGLFGIQQKGADNASLVTTSKGAALLVSLADDVSTSGSISETISALDEASNKSAEVATEQKGFFSSILEGFRNAGSAATDFFGSIFNSLSGLFSGGGAGGGGGIFSFLGAGGLNIGQLFGGPSNAQMGTLAPWQTAASPVFSASAYTSGPGMFAAGGLVKRFAGGGNVNYQDRVPALLQPGEFVMKKSAVDAMGANNMAMMNATGKSGGNVVVNITNEGTPQDAQASQPKFDGEKFVIDIVTRDLRNNGPIRKSLRGGAA